MKEELQGKLVEILTSIQTAAGKASDFAMEQLPDVAQSYVAYGRAISALWFFSWLVALSICLVAAWWFYSKPWFSTWSWDKDKEVRADTNVMAIVASGVAAFFCAAGAVSAASMGALVWFAPKVWLLKEIASLVK